MDDHDYETRELRRAIVDLTTSVEELTKQIAEWDPVKEMLEHIPCNTHAQHRDDYC